MTERPVTRKEIDVLKERIRVLESQVDKILQAKVLVLKNRKELK